MCPPPPQARLQYSLPARVAPVPRPPVNLQILLMFAGIAASAHKIGNGRAVVGYALAQTETNGLVQREQIVWAKFFQAAGRMKPGAETDFIGVNIADPGHQGLVQQRGFQAAAPGKAPTHYCQKII